MPAPAHRGGKAVNGGVSPFGNERVRYVALADDAALNAAVPRFKLDPAAMARFAFDVDHAGRSSVPVVSAHGIVNATVFVEGSNILRQRMAAAGNGQRPTAGVKLCGFSRAQLLGRCILPTAVQRTAELG